MSRLTCSLLAAALVTAGGAAAFPQTVSQTAPQTSLASAFATWKLEAATSLDAGSAKAKLASLRSRVHEAVKEAPDNAQLAALAMVIEERAAALKPQEAQTAEEKRPAQIRAQELVIAEAVVDAVRAGNAELVKQLGDRAVPALRSLALSADGTPAPKGALNPLTTLFLRDRAEGMNATLVLMESGDVLKKSYAAAALESTNIYSNNALWSRVGETNWKFKDAQWLRILEAAFEAPALDTASLNHSLWQQFRRGHVPKGQLSRVVDAWRTHRGLIVLPESIRSEMTELLTHPDEAVRIKAIESIAASRNPEAAYGLAKDPSRAARQVVAKLLKWHEVWSTAPDNLSNATSQGQLPELTEGYKAAVIAFTQEADESLRRDAIKAAADVVTERKEPLFQADELGAVLRTTLDSVDMYYLLSHLPAHPEAERLPLLLFGIELWADRLEAGPVSEMDAGLASNFLQLSVFGLSNDEDFWTVVDALSARGRMDESASLSVRRQADKRIEKSDVYGDRYAAWLVEHCHEEERPVRFLVGSSGSPLYPWAKAMSSPSRAKLVPLVAQRYPKSFQQFRSEALPIAFDDLASIAFSTDTHPVARQWAAEAMVTQHKGSIDAAAVTSLAPAFHDMLDGSRAENILRGLRGTGLDSEFVAALVRDPNVPAESLEAISGYGYSTAAAEAIFERFPPSTWGSETSNMLLSEAVRVLALAAKDTADPRLAAANIKDSRLQISLARGVAERRGAALFPLVASILDKSDEGSNAWKIAVTGASGYFNDDAAALLLETARDTTSAENRQFVMAALNQMTDWRNSAAAWEKSNGAAAKRDKAVTELLSILDDAKQPVAMRAEALRGLGLLGAAEELPRLIRALGSEEAPMAAAARAALDRLNAEKE